MQVPFVEVAGPMCAGVVLAVLTVRAMEGQASPTLHVKECDERGLLQLVLVPEEVPSCDAEGMEL